MPDVARPPPTEVTEHLYGQLWRWRDDAGRLCRIELRSANGKTLHITAEIDWDERKGQRKANGRGVSSGYFYYGGAEHFITAWDDGSAGGDPMPFETWVEKTVAELESRARSR